MSRAATEPADTTPPRGVETIETDLAADQDAAEAESRSNLMWEDASAEDYDPSPADWSEDSAAPAPAGETVEAAPAEETPATPEESAAAPAVAPATPDPLVSRLAELAEQQAALLSRLAPPAEAVAAPQALDPVSEFSTNAEYRAQAIRDLGLDPTNPYAVALAASLVHAQANANAQAAMSAKLEQFQAALAAKEAAATQSAALASLDAAFAKKMASYEPIDADVQELFHEATRQGVASGVSPQEALDAVFGKLGKLLRPKTQVAPQAQAAPRAAAASPAQARLERAAAVSGRAAVRATTKRNSTAALRALEGGSGWGR